MVNCIAYVRWQCLAKNGEDQYRPKHNAILILKRQRMALGGGVLLRKVYLHHFLKFDVVDIDNEYYECYYLNASLYPFMSKLMIE